MSDRAANDPTTDERLRAVVSRQPYPLIFATISGAHLYGFPSPDSDYDLRGCHVLPVREVVGLDTGPETIESSKVEEGLELDLVTHDARKFFALMLKTLQFSTLYNFKCGGDGGVPLGNVALDALGNV